MPSLRTWFTAVIFLISLNLLLETGVDVIILSSLLLLIVNASLWFCMTVEVLEGMNA
jgi:small-conductance mechanosensitive channel